MHRAKTLDGTDVAVKIQYPGIDKAIRSDLKNIDMLETVLRASTMGKLDVKQSLEEQLFRQYFLPQEATFKTQKWQSVEPPTREHDFIRLKRGDNRQALAMQLGLATNILEAVSLELRDGIHPNAELGTALATAVKLHVNVEGGYGPTWQLQHRETLASLLAAVDGLSDAAVKGFARCLAG